MSLVRNTEYGKVEGFEENGIYKWLNIPFAKPPVGELRFKRAQKADAWKGVKACKELGNAPYQFYGKVMEKALGGKVPFSEDCLNMNVWAPKNAKKLPVFVWIYGGANHAGQNSVPEYSAEAFAHQDMIGVNFNYRVGALGFYDFSKLDSSFDTNCALSDMLMALQFVHDNIEQFGGDPDNVTICGESAGGTAVYTLLAAPSSQGLFHKAIAMSGLAGNVTSYRTHELNNALMLERLGIDKSNASKLRELSVRELQEAAEAVMDHSKYNPGILLTGPVLDGDLLPYKPWEAMEKGINKDVKCIFGTCRDEGTFFYMMKMACQNWDEVKIMLERSGCPEKLDELKQTYANMSEKQAMQEIARERMFWVDAIRCANAQSKNNTVYSYRYDFASGLEKLAGLGATHGSDICSGLDTWKGTMYMLNLLSPKAKIKKMHDYTHGSFVNFAKTGDPNGAVPVQWKPYNEDTKETLLLNQTCSTVQNPNEKYFEAWKDIFPYE